MKQLHRINDISIGLFDSDNYYTGIATVVKSGKNEGKEHIGETHFFSCLAGALEDAIKRAVNQRITENKVKTVKEYLAEFKSLQAELAQTMSPLPR